MSNRTSAADIKSRILSLVTQYWEIAHAESSFVPGRSPVPVSGRVFDATDLQSLVDTSLDFWLTAGPANDSFEEKLAGIIGRRYVRTVNSGSSANLVALAGLTSHHIKDRALKPGDEVITAATGFPTTINPILLFGMVPVFVDVDIPTYNIRADLIEGAITDRTRAIMIAHTLGNPFDLDAVMAIAKKHDLWVIEDCCDALGSLYRGRHVGSFGAVGTLSFYPAHHITMGEGGAVFCDDPMLKRAMESFRDWGRDCYCAPGEDNTCGRRFDWTLGDLPPGYDHKYIYSHLGFNLKITDMQAAVGLAQLGHLDRFIQARKRNFERLHSGLRDIDELFILPAATPNSDPSWFGFPLTLRDGAPFTREELLRHLNEKKIGTRLLFGGNLVKQPYMKGRVYRVFGALENSDTVMTKTFWLGVFPGLGPAAIDYVLETIHDFCRKR